MSIFNRQKIDDDQEETFGNLIQQIVNLEAKVRNMTIPLTENGLNTLSLRTAEQIEDLFAMHHRGGRAQRLAKIQLIIRETLREIATGEKDWKTWTPNSFLTPPDKPT